MNAVTNLSEEKIVTLYRYLSFIITSLLYFSLTSNHSTERKLVIITLLAISAHILCYLYKNSKNSNSKTIALILLETVGNVLILIPSGGLASPYVWYSLNTIFIASLRLKSRYCWSILFVYLLVANLTNNVIHGESSNIIYIIESQLNIIMALILVTGLVQIITSINKDLLCQKRQLVESNAKLTEANKEVNKNLAFIMDLYEWVDVLIEQQDETSMKRMTVDYLKKITESKNAVFITNSCRNKMEFVFDLSSYENLDRSLLEYIYENLELIVKSEEPCLFIGNRGTYILSSVKNDIQIYGILCSELLYDCDENLKYDYSSKIKFLSKIGAMGLSKIEMGELSEKLVEDRERDRIAEEIHDGVLQRLFGLSCYLYGVSKNINKNNNQISEDELQNVRNSLNIATKELREAIYGMSTSKGGLDSFSINLESYIKEIQYLYDVDIQYLLKGDYCLLTTSHKKAFYRIIAESISNSIRHGNATKIKVNLTILNENIRLKIVDNGIGFDFERLGEERMGLGIRNMKHLMYSLGGRIEIKSSPGKGTRIIAAIDSQERFAS